MTRLLITTVFIVSSTTIADKIPRAFVRFGVMVVPNTKRTYYLQTNQYTEVSYRNSSIDENSSVKLELGFDALQTDSKGNLHSLTWSYPSSIELKKVSPGVWRDLTVHIRHVLGGNWKSVGMKFVFRVKPPNGNEYIERCSENPKSFFSIIFPYITLHNWETTPGQLPDLKVTGIKCVNIP